MPIKATCSNCNATLRVPDTAAGKKIKCPKCQTVMVAPQPEPVPAAETVALPPKPVEAAPTPAPAMRRRAVEHEPPPPEPEERPRRRRSRKRKDNRLRVGLAIGGCALAIAATVVILVQLNRGPAETASKTISPSLAAQTAESEQVEKLPTPRDVAKSNPANAPDRTAGLSKLKQLGLALHHYLSDRNSFPTQSIGGRKQLSWRVEILEYIEQRPLHSKFKLDEPWDSEHNKSVLESNPMPWVFQPERPNLEETKTYLQLFTGPGTCYPTADTRPKLISMRSGASNTWLLAEAKTPVEWTKPADLELRAGQVPQLGGVFGGDFFVLCADGTPYYISGNQFPPSTILSLVNPQNSQPISGWPPP